MGVQSYLKGSLVRRESNEAAAIWRELPKEAGGLLHIDHSEVREKILMEAADSVPVRPRSARADPPPLETMNHILILDPPGFKGWGVLIHRPGLQNNLELNTEIVTGGLDGGRLHHRYNSVVRGEKGQMSEWFAIQPALAKLILFKIYKSFVAAVHARQ